MNFKKIFKNVFRVASTDEFRPAMNGVFMHNGRLTTSDGYKMVSVPCEILENEQTTYPLGEIIPTDIFKSVVDNTYKTFEDVTAELYKDGDGISKIKTGRLEQSYYPIDSKFPPFEKLMTEAQQRLNEKSKVLVLSFNLSHLIELQKALFTAEKSKDNNSCISMAIYMDENKDDCFTSNKMILVHSNHPDSFEAIGAFMPIRSDLNTIQILQDIKFELRPDKLDTVEENKEEQNAEAITGTAGIGETA